MALTKLHDDLWIGHNPHSTMLGLKLGSRMTVVRLADGGLLLHSPIALDHATIDELRALGEVTHVVAPNLYHHLHAGPAVEAFPEAQLHGPAALHRKRRDLSFDHTLTETRATRQR